MGRKAEAIAILFMIVGAAVAAAQAPPGPSIVQCGAKCAVQCVRARFPPLIAFCFSLCMVTCKNSPTPPVSECTYACAKTLVTNTMRINSNRIAVETVSDYVESCYESCSKE